LRKQKLASNLKLHRETLRQMENRELPSAAGGQLTTAKPTFCDPYSGCYPTCALTCQHCTA
jgi:hypothetical protein